MSLIRSPGTVSTIQLTHITPTRSITPTSAAASAPAAEVDGADQLRPVTQRKQIFILISSFLTIFVTIGFNQSYGVFQSYYTSSSQDMLPASAREQIALIAFVGTLGAGLTWAGSIFVNPMMARCDDWQVGQLKGSVKWLTVAGVLLMSLGFGLASLATEIWHLLLTQGLLYGVGSSLLYFPILSTTPEYFNTHRGAAMGLVLAGSGIGGLVLSPMTRSLLTAIGPRWTLRLFSLLNLAISLPIALTAAPSRFVARRQTHVDIKLALKPAFIFSVGAAFLQAAGNLLPLTFLVEYSLAVGYTAEFGAVLLAVSNGTNSVFRILAGYAGDRFGRQNTLILMVLFSAITVVSFWLSSITSSGGSQALWVCFVVFYGVAGGGYNALFPTTVVEVFGLQAYASVNGFMYFIRGVGAMIGSPVGGKILGEGWTKVVLFDFGLLAGASLCVVCVRFLDASDKKSWKWRA